MEFLEVFRLYDDLAPSEFETKGTSHGVDDYGMTIFAQWPDKKSL